MLARLAWLVGLAIGALPSAGVLAAMTLCAPFPDDPDVAALALIADGVAVSTIPLSGAFACALWEVPVSAGAHTAGYSAVSIDASGNRSAPSDVLGAPSILKLVRLRRALAGLPLDVP